MFKQTLFIGSLAIILTGCVVTPSNDARQNVHQNFEFHHDHNHSGYDLKRHDGDQQESWRRHKGAEANQNRPNPFMGQDSRLLS